jgi:hypothetical protein
LLAGQSLQGVVAHPEYLCRMAKGNAAQNRKRQKMLELGRAAKNVGGQGK